MAEQAVTVANWVDSVNCVTPRPQARRLGCIRPMVVLRCVAPVGSKQQSWPPLVYDTPGCNPFRIGWPGSLLSGGVAALITSYGLVTLRDKFGQILGPVNGASPI
jgi:hypothetical protein